MNFKKYRPVFEIVIVSIVAYIVHKSVFYFLQDNPKFTGFYYPLESVYGFFGVCALVILFILIEIRARNIDNVGYTFLLVTFIKMGISYAFLKPILLSGLPNIAIEKINFFIVFALFLAIETIATIRILNNKQ
jgi:hypothetical protein